MKMIITIVKDDDADVVIHALTSNKYRVTRIASTGGLFRKGNSTLLSGVDDDQIDAYIAMVKSCEFSASTDQKKFTLFVIPVDHYERV